MKTAINIDVTALEPRMKHPTIFREFDLLAPGEALTIHNDHDPKPLYYQLLAERGDVFTWTYDADGPEFWDVTIAKKTAEQKEATIGQLVAKDYRKAEVFKKYGLDFCCGGKKTIDKACQEKGIDAVQVKKEIEAIDNDKGNKNIDTTNWEVPQLIEHIVNTHHRYVRSSLPLLFEFSQKVARVHGDRHPQTIQIAVLVNDIKAALEEHLEKEELEVFPLILKIASNNSTERSEKEKELINSLEDEHTEVGQMFELISNLSERYNPPAGSCSTFKVLYAKLKEFEDDLHTHIHLENNVLLKKI